MLIAIFRCDIDGEYFPAPEAEPRSELKGLNNEDAELLSALQELASIYLF
jgi:hypothetical protein